MTYRKRTLRAMPPTTRRLARLIGDMESVTRRAKNLLTEIQTQERESIALRNRRGVPTSPDDEAGAQEIADDLAQIGHERRTLGELLCQPWSGEELER